MLRKLVLVVAPAMLFALPLAAENAVLTGEVDISHVDADSDGMVNLLELQMAWPQLTEADFIAWDVNADGGLDAAELTVAFEAGLITDPADSGGDGDDEDDSMGG